MKLLRRLHLQTIAKAKYLRTTAPIALCLGLIVFAENTAIDAYNTVQSIESSRPSLSFAANRWVIEKLKSLGGMESLFDIGGHKSLSTTDLAMLASYIKNLLPLVHNVSDLEGGAESPFGVYTSQIQELGNGVIAAMATGDITDAGFRQALTHDLTRLKTLFERMNEELNVQSAVLIDMQGKALDASRHALLKLFISLLGAVASMLMLLGLNSKSRREAEFQASHDATTGLLNRQGFEKWIDSYERSSDRLPLALVVLDVDDFKEVNDEFGHMAGDTVLRAFVRQLTANFGPNSHVARWGGDEFVVALPIDGFFDAGAVTMLRSAFTQLNTSVQFGTTEIVVRCSAGAAFCPSDATTVREALQFADLALYKAKRQGAGRLQFYDAEIRQERQRVLTIRDRLRNALKDGQLQLHWQPQVNVAYPHVPSAEALLRWYDRETGAMVPPALFIPAAETSELILEIDNFVLDQAIRTAAAWSKKWQHPPTVAVNVSAMHFQQREFVSQVRDLLRLHNLHPHRLELEITEGVILGDDAVVSRNLEGLEQLGVRLALDDFGTGYSNIAYLSHLKPDRLKIDQTFVRRIGHDKQMKSLVSAIIGIGRAIDCDVVAEGVETAEQLAEVKSLGCNLVQGYYFAKPMPADAFEAWRDANYPDEQAAVQQLRQIGDRMASSMPGVKSEPLLAAAGI
ncbi:putative bifunctional diguanylate cyclase/phosphodiesterase [Oryzibacter oryziterrae]|uniref:putative bifunctional diguanylate cyclase/phosphodiesterase n=1 Tax=Oryzibacter oryziterrae TaxID=2766474 RepID=UPI001F21C163|nr:bifunctional diguanylate cyclase/phosphodiesterase [Oryzibacter oryziterrae]